MATACVDCANADSIHWVAVDLFYVCLELLYSGWTMRVLNSALAKLQNESTGLAQQVSRTARWLRALQIPGRMLARSAA